MKLLYTIIFSLLLFLFAGCVKDNISAASAKTNTVTTPTDAYWYNGTTGTALIRVTCSDCSALATIGNATVPFLFNSQGVGLLKYTPASGLSVYLAVCPGSVKPIKAEILDAANASLYTYSGVIDNWNNTYVIK